MARLLWLLPVGLAAIAVATVLDTEFSNDDFLHLYQLSNFDPLTFLTTSHGRHLYYARNAYLLILHSCFGDDPKPYFAVVIGLHLVNVLLMARVLTSLTGRVDWGLFGAALWGTSPPLLGALGWVSAHGFVLVVTCILWILDDVVRLRSKGAQPPTWVIARWIFLLFAASSSSGVGIAVAMAFCLALPLLWTDSATRRSVVTPIASILVFIPLLYVVQFGWRNSNGSLTLVPGASLTSMLELTVYAASYAFGSGVGGGLVACTYPRASVAAGPFMGGAYESVLALSVGLFALLLVVLAVHIARGRKRVVLDAAAFLLLAVACYFMIGVGRAGYVANQGIEVSKAATWPRYHYTGGFLVIATAILILAPRGRPVTLRSVSALAVWALAIGYPTYQATRDVGRFVLVRGQAEFRMVQEQLHKEIARAPEGRPIFLRNHSLSTVKLGPRSLIAFPGRAAVFVITYPENEVDGRTVYFVESNQEVLDMARADPSARSATLLITPAERRKLARPASQK